MLDPAHEAARLIAEARRTGRSLDRLPADCRPSSLEAGYAVQHAFRARWPDRVAGWKIGATSQTVKKLFGVSEPIIAPFFAADVMASPARPSAARFRHRAIESEFAFRLGCDLAPRESTYSRAEVIAAVDAALPAIEMLAPRFNEMPFGDVACAVADCVLNAGMVLGQASSRWQEIDLAEQAVVLTVDGVERARGRGADVLGHPLNVLEWAVNWLSSRGIALAAGNVISTGTCTGVVTLEPEQKAVADFGLLGRVEVAFAQPP